MSLMSWLLDSDPSIRWQVMRDLSGEAEEVVAAERARVAREGWGADLLDRQRARGGWAEDDEGWMTTIYSLVLLKDLGVDPKDERVVEAIGRVRNNLRWRSLGNRAFFDGETEPCVNGALLAVGSYFGVASEALVDLLLGGQQKDGGWNCEAPESRRGSFHTTICVLEGLREYERAGGAKAPVKKARRRGEEYLLARRLHKSLATGEVIDKSWLRFSFPPSWHFDLLRGLDYFRSVGLRGDERVEEALDVVELRRHRNGRWPMNLLHEDRLPFDMEVDIGSASRWNTLRALRVLKWFRPDEGGPGVKKRGDDGT
jgi:hypothetical protein